MTKVLKTTEITPMFDTFSITLIFFWRIKVKFINIAAIVMPTLVQAPALDYNYPGQ